MHAVHALPFIRAARPPMPVLDQLADSCGTPPPNPPNAQLNAPLITMISGTREPKNACEEGANMSFAKPFKTWTFYEELEKKMEALIAESFLVDGGDGGLFLRSGTQLARRAVRSPAEVARSMLESLESTVP